MSLLKHEQWLILDENESHRDGNTPVPGYSTVIPLYEQTQYALPGERTEAL